MAQELYKLPKGWEWKTVGESCILENGDRGKNYPSRDSFVEFGVPVINAGCLNGEFIDEAELSFISQERYDIIGNGKVKNGDVLFCLRGSLGKCAISNLDKGVIASSLVIVRPKDSLLREFLLRYFNSSLCSRLISEYDNGAAQPNLAAASLKLFDIPLPPLPEQKRIVAKLDALLSRIAQASQELQESLVLADHLMMSSLNELFSELANKHRVVNLSSLVTINSGIALPSIFQESHNSGPIPFYKVAQMNNHSEIMINPEITFSHEISRSNKIKIFPKGSVLIPKRGGAILTNKKRLLVEDASYDSNVMGLKANDKLLNDDFLFNYMRTVDLGNFVDASTIPQINNKHIDQMQIPIVPLDEQKSCNCKIKSIVDATHLIQKELGGQLKLLSLLKASLLDAAFRGGL